MEKGRERPGCLFWPEKKTVQGGEMHPRPPPAGGALAEAVVP